jgi:glucose/arabinose dehydrogenase
VNYWLKSGLAGLILLPTALTAQQIAVAPAPLPAGESREHPAPRTVEGQNWDTRAPENAKNNPLFKEQTRAPYKKVAGYKVATLTEKLGAGWSLAFLPGGKLLISEKLPGALRILDAQGNLSTPLAGLEGLSQSPRKLGLLEVALAPDFASSKRIYFCFFEVVEKGYWSNTNLAYGTLDEATGAVRNVKVIFKGLPEIPLNNSSSKQGGRIAFAKDGSIFLAMGDRDANRHWDYMAKLAQKLDNHLGKILHLTPEGAPAKDNPFLKTKGALPEIWAYGLRDTQGIAFDPNTGKLWENEHGPRGGDELNIVLRGRNYGWPIITRGINYTGEPIGEGTAKKGMEQPVYYWDPVIAPSGMAFYQGDLFPQWKNSVFVSGLRGIGIYRLEIKNDKVVVEEPMLTEQKLRMRDVKIGPDGAVYALAERGKLFKLTPP